MFFDESTDAMSSFIGAAMNDLAVLLSELSTMGAGNLDENAFFEKYRVSMVVFSRKLVGHTSKLRREWPASATSSLSLIQQLLSRSNGGLDGGTECAIGISSNNAGNNSSSSGILSLEIEKQTGSRQYRKFSRDMSTQANIRAGGSGNASVQTVITIPVDYTGSGGVGSNGGDNNLTGGDDDDGDIDASPVCSNSNEIIDWSLASRATSTTPSMAATPTTSQRQRNGSSKAASTSNRIAGPKRMLRFEQTAVLRGVYAKNTFLTPEQRNQLAKELNITAQQIKIWFQNRRFKDKMKARQQTMADNDEF